MVYAKKKKPLRRTEETAPPPREEEIMSTLDRGVNAIVERWKPIGGVIVVIAVVLGGVSIYNTAHASKEDKAAAALYDAEMELPDPAGFAIASLDDADSSKRIDDLLAAVPAFEQVHADFGNTVGGDIAELEAANALLEAGDAEAAATHYATAAGSGSRMVRQLALNGQAVALECLEQYAEAAAPLRKVADEGAGAIKEYAYLDLARVQQLAGDDAAALATCREFEQELPDSPLLEQAQAKIRELGEEPADIATEEAEGQVAQ
jgi:hypothetical protein